MSTDEYKQLISNIIETKDLYGRSFTRGLALYYAIKEGRLDDDTEERALEIIKEATQVSYNTAKGAAEDSDLALLDEVDTVLRGGENE